MTSVIDRMARWSMLLLTWTVILGVVAGIVVAVIWRRDVDWTVYNAPYAAASLAMAASALLALPAFLLGVFDLIRGNWVSGTRRIFYLLGAVTVFLCAELFSHYLVPCDLVIGLGWGTPDWGVPWGGEQEGFACRQLGTVYGDRNGVYSRSHLLHHLLLGGLPALLLYRFLLDRIEKARPAVGRPAAL